MWEGFRVNVIGLNFQLITSLGMIRNSRDKHNHASYRDKWYNEKRTSEMDAELTMDGDNPSRIAQVRSKDGNMYGYKIKDNSQY